MMRVFGLWKTVLRVDESDQKLWGIVRDADQHTQYHGFLFMKNMDGRNKKRSKQKKQKSWGGNRGNPRHGQRKMMQK